MITANQFQIECESIAEEAFNEFKPQFDIEGDDPRSYLDDMQEYIWQSCDGHQWVIYHRYSHEICLNCDTSEGEAALEDVGMPNPVTYDSLASAIVFWEMKSRVESYLNELIEAYNNKE